MDNSTMQVLMNKAYDFWQSQKGMSQVEFWDNLDLRSKAAVVVGNLNYQVCNGGFAQWHYNGYSEAFGIIDLVCRQVNTKNSLDVLKIAEDAMKIIEEYGEDDDDLEFDDLDTQFYKICEVFLEDVECWLNRPE